MSKKVGILGGTFNPIHLGHLLLAERAFSEYKLDKVLLMPTGISYLKAASSVLNKDTRVEMTALAIEGNEHFELSRIEVDREGNTYTYETLEDLKKDNPDTSYYFILGADSLFQIENWMKPDIIMKDATILVAVREGQSLEELEAKANELMDRFSADIRILECPYVDISSTDIRKRVHDGKSIRYMVADSVFEYIKEKGLYL